ncbi:MAG: PIN domain-containing protein [Cytophagaceae bacterium]|nr:PIN domain-containing protein [Gemmatimonadaceae bacterium]
MVVYAESSAVLAWLLGQSEASRVVSALSHASHVVTSELTDIECARAFHRALSLTLVTKSQAAALHDSYSTTSKQWDRLTIGDRVRLLASAPWPVEPVRALDAIHLGSALVAREAWPDLVILTLDQRVRRNAVALGLAEFLAP